MDQCDWEFLDSTALTEVVGYLNFSSGAPDAKFRRNLNLLFEQLESRGPKPWEHLGEALREQVDELARAPGVLGSVDQAAAVVELLFQHVLDEYWKFHGDLLFHHQPHEIFRPLFLAIAAEAVLRVGPPWEESARVAREALTLLNDFVGHRPIAVLNTRQKAELYPHERVRPVPLYLRGAGVGVGKYQTLIEQTLDILRQTEPDLLFEACLDFELLDELAFDPRAYDFDHPVNKRPNYHFGQWDPHHIDNQGRYRRFVWQQIPLDILLERVSSAPLATHGDRLWESAAVLAGTTLMAAYTSGRGPDTHDSGVSLSTLLPRIATLRDNFYRQLLDRRAGPHGESLRAEAQRLKQPLAGARQHLNQCLARLRARQQQHTHLAGIFANMGYAEASLRQAQIVPVASARMCCEIDCDIVSGHHAVDRGQLDEAARALREIDGLLQRAIRCGAIVDPWNILGFQGQFAIFQALENAVRDHRIDDLTERMSRVFGLYARVESEAAATGQVELRQQLAKQMQDLAAWWDRYASTEVDSVHGVSGRDSVESAHQVADALAAWHRGGAAAGDISFWRQHVESFRSPKAYALVVRALLDKHDHVAAMALLMQWLSQAEEIRLVQEDFSFHELAVRWMRQMLGTVGSNGNGNGNGGPVNGGGAKSSATAESPAKLDDAGADTGCPHTGHIDWPVVKKFFDYLEANADAYWEAPRLDLTARRKPPRPDRDEFNLLDDASDEGDEAENDDEDDGESSGDLYRAAYENVAYRDSTADGHEGSTLEGGTRDGDDLLERESPRLLSRLAFLRTLARAWRFVSSAVVECDPAEPGPVDDDTLAGWLQQALENRRQLLRLWQELQEHSLPNPTGAIDSLIEYERRSRTKQTLLERTVQTFAESAAAVRAIPAATAGLEIPAELPPWEHRAVQLLRAMQQGELAAVREHLDRLLAATSDQPLLYVPPAKGGDPVKMANSQALYHVLRELLAGLPRLGLLNETVRLLTKIQDLERNHRVGAGAVTEFDHLFRLAFQAIVQCVLDSSQVWQFPDVSPRQRQELQDEELLGCLQKITESLLGLWLGHSRLLRLSALEKIAGDQRWRTVVDFIERYGKDLFTARFLNWGNLRAILEQGVETWLVKLDETADDDQRPHLLDELGTRIPRDEAVEILTTILESVLENYVEYRDFNSTTTQSDHGDQLYQLLDFLRLKTRYERICWNLQPVVIVHQMLERQGRAQAAARWRQMVAERTQTAADWHVQRLATLVEQHAMRLHTIADRVEERFVRPLALDRIRALIPQCMREARIGVEPRAFEQLEREVAQYAERPSGSGLDLPAWLMQLESDVSEILRSGPTTVVGEPAAQRLPPARLTLAELNGQINAWQPPE